MTTRRPLPLLAAAALLLTACGGESDEAGPGAPPPGDTRAAAPAPALPPPAAGVTAWRSNPAEGIAIRQDEGGATVVDAGPHVVLWPADGRELAPPYTLRATLQKRRARLHEGVGVIFGASGLDRPEAEQRYSYFLVRGDGSWLVKRRQGARTPVVRDWTRHPAVERDRDEGGERNELEVRVTEQEVAFLVNGAEVARVPAAGLDVRGLAGVRAAHDVQLAVSGFQAVPGAPSGPPADTAAPADTTGGEGR